MTTPGIIVVVLSSTCRNCGRVGENMICRGCFAAYCARTIECAACDCPTDDEDDEG